MEKEKHSIIEDKIVLVKKYGVIGILALLFPFVEPIISKYLEEYNTAKYEKVKLDFANLVSSKDNRLKTPTLIAVSKLAVGKQSIHKVEAIRMILYSYSDLDKNSNRVKLAIRNELYKQSDVYIKFLNTLAPHPSVGYIGEYISNNFDMEVFLQGIYAIVLSDYSIEMKCNDLMQYMLSEQEVFFNELINKVNNKD